MSLAKRGEYEYLQDWEFWRVCLITQIREFEVDLLKGDIDHAKKELIDTCTVAIDALRLQGFDFWRELYARLIENAPKYVEKRGPEFYREKLAKEEARIVQLGGRLTESDYSSIRLRNMKCTLPCGICGTTAEPGKDK